MFTLCAQAMAEEKFKLCMNAYNSLSSLLSAAPAITHMTNVATCIIGFANRRLLLCFNFSLRYTHFCQEASSDIEGWSHCSVL